MFEYSKMFIYIFVKDLSYWKKKIKVNHISLLILIRDVYQNKIYLSLHIHIIVYFSNKINCN